MAEHGPGVSSHLLAAQILPGLRSAELADRADDAADKKRRSSGGFSEVSTWCDWRCNWRDCWCREFKTRNRDPESERGWEWG
jgi:hypothetical protein